MKDRYRIAFYFFISFLILGTAKIVYGGPVYPIIEEDEKKSSDPGPKEKLKQLEKEVQKNIEKTERVRTEEKQQETTLKDIKNKLQEVEKQLPS
jgi:hypothetical protein